ncbi:hypothetical protein D3C80_1367830 [compost metagenome]
MARLRRTIDSAFAPLRPAHLVFQRPSRMSMSRAQVSASSARVTPYSSDASTLRSQRRIFCRLLALRLARYASQSDGRAIEGQILLSVFVTSST